MVWYLVFQLWQFYSYYWTTNKQKKKIMIFLVVILICLFIFSQCVRNTSIVYCWIVFFSCLFSILVIHFTRGLFIYFLLLFYFFLFKFYQHNCIILIVPWLFAASRISESPFQQTELTNCIGSSSAVSVWIYNKRW